MSPCGDELPLSFPRVQSRRRKKKRKAGNESNSCSRCISPGKIWNRPSPSTAVGKPAPRQPCGCGCPSTGRRRHSESWPLKRGWLARIWSASFWRTTCPGLSAVQQSLGREPLDHTPWRVSITAAKGCTVGVRRVVSLDACRRPMEQLGFHFIVPCLDVYDGIAVAVFFFVFSTSEFGGRMFHPTRNWDLNVAVA